MQTLSSLDFVPASALRHEWLITNGLSGYSSSTVIGMNSRKYHGLLVAPLSGTGKRHVMLSKFEDYLAVGDSKFPLSTNSYSGAYFPTGFQNQVGFSYSGHPVFTYSAGGAKLEKSVRMVHGKNAVVVSYRLISGKNASLSARPFLRPREIHADPQTGAAGIPFESGASEFSISKPAKMRVVASYGKFESAPEYYYGMQYETEARRGYPAQETLFSPGAFAATLSRGEEYHIVASLEGLTPGMALELLDRQHLKFTHLAEGFSRTNGMARTDFGDSLLRAADQFILLSERRKGIIAGYPWFSEWGRDSMISLPGLLLSTGRHALARELLLSHASKMKDGLLPNFIDDEGKASYNSADASLWFVNALRQYAEATGDYSNIQKYLWKPLRSFLSSTVRGNSLISMDSDCLLRVHDPAGTWMDAKVGGAAVTPRKGKPVEINALWHSNLHFIRSLAFRFSDKKTEYESSAILESATPSFQKFLSHEGGLFDVLEPNDSSLRPNQIFAASLPNSPLQPLQQRHLFNIVRSRLYTPLGLRTLSPEDSHYHETYEGSPEARDSAYHQGIIWPWLLGAFYDAQLAVYPGTEASVLSSLRPFAEAMKDGCIGQVPELYEPKTMRPEGALAQAWSVAEVLRIYAKVKKASPAQEQPMLKLGNNILARA